MPVAVAVARLQPVVPVGRVAAVLAQATEGLERRVQPTPAEVAVADGSMRAVPGVPVAPES